MTAPYVVTISSEKGGVGKTTLATNLAIYLKGIDEDLPVTLFSFDNHFSVDKMFRISRGAPRGTVADLLEGTPAEELTELGEFGVQFIPSSQELTRRGDQLNSPGVLGQVLARSGLEGVVLIDTRPTLDIYTRNALYAADRVIIPVKDAPSLENCRNIYELFQSLGLPKRNLRILPCLVDSRIRYKGTFRDAHQLLRAFAINRGYRCLEGLISKSPKVEALNTNPEGRIYPVLTHGRNTEVHSQFTRVARQLFLDMQQATSRRVAEIGAGMAREELERRRQFAERRRRLHPGCLACDMPLVKKEGIDSRATFYAESSDGQVAGFLDEHCVNRMVFQHFFKSPAPDPAGGPLHELFRETAQRSYFVLRRTPRTRGFHPPRLSFYRFDESGKEISHKTFELPKEENAGEEGLQRLVGRSLLGTDGRLGEAFLMLRRVSSDFPEEVLYPERYGLFLEAAERMAAQFPED